MTKETPLKIIFAGTPDFAAVVLEALIHSPHQIQVVYTQPDRPAGRGRELKASRVKELALKNHLKVFQPQTLRDEAEQKILASFNADLMIVVAYGLILPESVLKTPRLGCINVHASLLPKWRGAAPIQRAILSGDVKTGVTIMQMNAGLDTGDMLLKVECIIDKQDTSQSLHDRLAKLGAEALLITLEKFPEIKPEKQNEEASTYAQKISKEEANIDWQESAKSIHQKIRAFNPWPIAQTTLNGEIIRVWQAEVIDKEAATQGGKILQISRDGIDVATGEGVLQLQKIQLPGGRVLNVSDVLNGREEYFQVGLIFS